MYRQYMHAHNKTYYCTLLPDQSVPDSITKNSSVYCKVKKPPFSLLKEKSSSLLRGRYSTPCYLQLIDVLNDTDWARVTLGINRSRSVMPGKRTLLAVSLITS